MVNPDTVPVPPLPSTRQNVTIVPPAAGPDGVMLTQGTEVRLADGSTLKGVTKIVLTAVPDDIWRAEVHVNAGFGLMAADLHSLVDERAALEETIVRQGQAIDLLSATIGSYAAGIPVDDWLERVTQILERKG